MFIPPKSDDWDRIAYQPMLYLSTFLAALTILIFGDFTTMGGHAGIPADTEFGLYGVWTAMSLCCPVLGLGSLWLIQNREGRHRYRGLWLRLGADVGQFFAMTTYLVLRISWGDFHVYPVTIMGSAALFVAHLVMRDIRRLMQVESLASRLHRGRRGDR